MEDMELIDSVCDLVAIADVGIADAIGSLTLDADSSAVEAVLDACLGNIETIATAVEMAQADDLRQICSAVDAHLRSLNGDAGRYLQEYGPRLVHWGSAVLAYLRQTNAPELANKLLGPLPDRQRAELQTGLRLATIVDPVEVTPDYVTAEERATEIPTLAIEETTLNALPSAVPASIAQEMDFVAILDNEVALETAADITITPDACLQAEPMSESISAVTSEAVQAGTDLPIAVEEDGGQHEWRWADGLLTEPPSVAAVKHESSVSIATTVESNEEPTLKPSSIEEDQAESVELVLKDEFTANDSASIAEASEHDTAAHPGEVVADISAFEAEGSLVEPFAELATWLDALTAPSTNVTDLARAIAGYTNVIRHVQDASVTMGLSGLGMLCAQLIQNVQAFAELDADDRSAIRTALETWPTVVSAHLSDPEDETACLAVITHASQSVWPHPMTDEQAAEWVALLAPDTDNPLTEVEARPTIARPEDVALALADDVNPKLISVFLQESPANAAHFTHCVECIGRGEEVLKNLGVAQRLAHNLKGSANLIGVKGVANLTHHLEDILEYLTEHRIAPSLSLARVLQEGADCVETMLEALQGLTAPPPDAQHILQSIYDWANRMDAGQLSETPMDAPVSDAAPTSAEIKAATATIETSASSVDNDVSASYAVRIEGADNRETAPTASAAAPAIAAPTESMLRVPTATFDALFRLVGEFSISIDQLQERFRAVQRQSNELRNQDDRIQQRRFDLEHCVDVRHVAAVQQRFYRSGGREQFDPLELDEYDELYSATHSFTETVTDSRRMLLQLRGELATVDHMFVQVQRMKRELQQAVMRTRMEPVGALNARLARAVRQACRATDKLADLTLEGAEVLLDSGVINKLIDPLMHILRNAVDHGIESPKQRIATGKPETGHIWIRFFQEGLNVVIECADDGRGLDYARIRETAVRRGLAHMEAADRPTLARLVLMPGFTTRDAATQLSGRGVGLDVVYAAIKELKGAMEIGDRQPSGCRITLRVPLNLMTHYCLVVEAAGRQYAIPTSTVDRALSFKVGQFSTVGFAVAYEFERRIYPAYSLAACLQLAHAGDTAFDAQKAALLVHSDDGLVALAVDRIVDSHHLVIRGLGRHVRNVRGVAGVSSLPDGRLIPVLDLADLLRTPETPARVTESQPQSAASTPSEVQSAPQVLIVDDSLSVRQSLADLMTEAGYQTLLARDGVEAVEVLRQQKPDIVLTDIEMPRMNGLELASYIRTTHGATLPIVTITSRTMQKHRQLAQQAGVDLYLTKPFAEDQLLSNIRSLLRREPVSHDHNRC